MGEQSANSKRGASNSINEAGQWFVASIMMLVILLSRFRDLLGIPFWLFYTVLFVLLVVLAIQSSARPPPASPLASPGGNLSRVFGYILFIVVLAEVVGFGFFIQNWQLLALWLPVTLTIGVILYLVLTTIIEKTIPPRFLFIPLVAIVLGGLIGFLVPGLGYLNSFLFSLAILSFAVGLRLRFRPQNG